MPNKLHYRTGSLIYFQSESADKIYLLQGGNVSLVYQDMESGADVHDPVQPGEFFGVRSALGRYQREENAVVLKDATVLALSVSEFEQFAVANTRLIMKMLQVFSQKLRRIHKQIASLLKTKEVNAEAGLYNVGDYYLKTGRFTQAKYVFDRYLVYYPDGIYVAQAVKNIKLAESSSKREASLDRMVSPESPDAAPLDPKVSAEQALAAAKALAEAKAMADEQAQAAEKAASGAPAPSDAEPITVLDDAAAAYYDALNFITQEQYKEAYSAFKKIVDTGTDAEYIEKSAFDMGRCVFLMGKYDECIKYYTQMLTKYPKHPELPDILFHMGQSHEKSDRKDQAATFYKKSIALSGDTNDGTKVKAKRALNALEV
ncbi:catabolite gene activator protein [Spirochaetia bacterium]|nr:catabolite gene activator protein [Spirochaetia bacterium]